MGAGILPIALYKGTIYLLLGQERTNLWSDFGGSANKNEKVSLLNAIFSVRLLAIPLWGKGTSKK